MEEPERAAQPAPSLVTKSVPGWELKHVSENLSALSITQKVVLFREKKKKLLILSSL